MTRSAGEPTDDRRARRVAATDFDTNLVVEAGAGTGKTSLLVERVLNAVGSGRLDMDRLAAITFTKKAAGEMRQRIAAGLEQLLRLSRPGAEEPGDRGKESHRAFDYLAREKGIPAKQIEERALKALQSLDRATIETIHTFCAALLRRFPVEARVDPSFEIDEGPNLSAILDESWETFLSRELGPGSDRIVAWKRMLESLDLGDIRRIAFDLAGFGVPGELLDASSEVATDSRVLLGDEAARLEMLLADILGRQEDMAKGMRGHIQNLASALGVFTAGGHAAFREHVAGDPMFAAKLGQSCPSYVGKNLAHVSREEVLATAREAHVLARGLFDADDDLARTLLETLRTFAIDTREEYLRRGFLGFDALLVLARDLLRDHPAPRDALKRRFGMLLVDEFQDTDPLQYEIVLFLGEKPGGRSRDAYQVELEPGRLFVVGDAKQSIYRFRGADFRAFTRAVEAVVGQGGDHLYLTRNFRSLPDVLQPVNALFRPGDESGWSRSPYQPEYQEIHAAREAAARPGVDLWTVADGEVLRAGERREQEGLLVAREIERLALEEIGDGEPNYGRISLLLRAFSDLESYLRPLRERGIPFIVDGGRGFLDRLEIGYLRAVLRTITRPADEAALLAHLRSPLGGVPDTELAGHAADGGRWDWRAEVDGSRHPKLAAAFVRLRELVEKTRDLPVDLVIRTVLDSSGLAVLGAATFEGPQKVANLRKLCNAAAGLGRDGRLSLNAILDHLEEQRTADAESDSPLADEGTNAVRVLTIHKAKGLENRVVIVPDLGRGEGGGTPPPVVVTELPGGSRAVGLRSGRFRDTVRLWYDLEQAKHERAEGLRLLYVATTRAMDRLVLVTGASSDPGPWARALAPWGYDPEAPPADGDVLRGGVVHRRSGRLRPEMSPPGGEEPRGEPESVERYRKAVARYGETAVPPFLAPSGMAHESRTTRYEDVPGEGAGPRDRDVARTAGSIVHAALEGWDLETDAGLLRRCESAPGDARDEARSILRAFLDSPLAAELREIEILGREVPMLLRGEGGSSYRGSIDLLYRDGSGKIVVADFKTDDTDDPVALADRYRLQLGIYAEAVTKAMGLDEPVAAEIWHLRAGRRISVG